MRVRSKLKRESLSCAAALSSALFMSLQSMEENKKFPVNTILETAPVSEVPFPAITVNAHNYPDDWVLLRYSVHYIS